MNAENRVARGAALLDPEEPGWFNRIDTDQLWMSRCDTCILGQLYGDYTVGLRALGLTHRQAIDRGFMMGEGVNYLQLTNEWRRVVEDRKINGVPPIPPAKVTFVTRVKELLHV
jgi:hypothetical protein